MNLFAGAPRPAGPGEAEVGGTGSAPGWASRTWPAVGLLLLLVGLAHGQAVGFDFVSFDDGEYVVENPWVQRGLSGDGVRWAFGVDHENTYFHPLTWLSLMLDRQLLGPVPWGFHLVNVLLHGAVVLLLFLALRRATGRPGPSLATAALFAVHPITLESVAWVTERKNVLSAAFGMAAIWVYVGGGRSRSWSRWAAVLALFALALLAKPPWVMLPALLLLLDWRPLGRFDGLSGDEARRAVTRAVLEKVPVGLLALGCAALTLHSARTLSAADVVSTPLAVRLANAVASLPRYAIDLVNPFGHAVLHPMPDAVPLAELVAGFAFLVGLLAAGAALLNTSPSVAAGSLWFLVALVPYLGLKQTGLWPSRADRFIYVAAPGLIAAVVFAAAGWWRRRGGGKVAPWVASGVVVAVLIGATVQQGGAWRDSLSLYRRAVEIEPTSGKMQFNLAATLMRQGRFAEARAHAGEAVRLLPRSGKVRVLYAGFLQHDGDVAGAELQYREAIRNDATCVEAILLLAESLRERGQLGEARGYYEAFLRVAPPSQQGAIEYVRALLR